MFLNKPSSFNFQATAPEGNTAKRLSGLNLEDPS